MRKYLYAYKGVAIILVVLGHCTAGMVNSYAYSYHLATFFFLSGCTYNEKKYCMHPENLFGNRVKSNWSKYVIYTSLIGILHFLPPFLGIYKLTGEGGSWDFFTYRNYVLNNLVMVNTEPLCGAMWFVPPMILASGLFGMIVWWSCLLRDRTGAEAVKHIALIGLATVCLILGNERMILKFTLPYRLDVALFVVPLFVIGYYCGSYLKDFTQYLKWYIALPCFLVTMYFCKRGLLNDLAGQYVEMRLFYLLAIVGIFQSLYFTKVILKTWVGKALAFIGQYTFEIMAFHFMVFKMIDVVYYRISHDTNIEILSASTRSYDLWYLYIPLACLIPSVLRFAYDKAKFGLSKRGVKTAGGAGEGG